MDCWICGMPATTGEHKTKRSDLRSLFGVPSQKEPLYFHTDERRNKRVGSLDAPILKSPARICNLCNSGRTQPHDRAWQQFSEIVRENEHLLTQKGSVRANRIFPYDTRRAMLYVHLYWVKIFGCAAAEGGIPVTLSPLADSILLGRANPNVYLSFGWMHFSVTMAGASNIEVALLDGVCAYATRFHNIGNLAVNLIYAIPGERRQGLIGAWHPRLGAKRLRLKPFDIESA